MAMEALKKRALNALKNGIALAIGLGITIGVLEGAARLLANALGVSPYMQYDKTLGWTATPGAVKRHKNPALGFEVTYAINGDGLRGPRYQKQKPAGAYRIVLLGDSNGFGWGIPEHKHLAALLDARFENVEVVNLSLSGYGTDQEYLRLCRDGLDFQPDLVILQVTENDFDEIQHAFFNQKPKPHFRLAGNGELQLSNVPVTSSGEKAEEFYGNSLPLPFKEWLGWHSYSYNWLNEKYYGVKRQYARPRTVGQPRFSADSIELFNRLLAEIGRKLDERHVRGLIVHASKEVSERNVFRNGALPVLDVWPRFSAYAQEHSALPMFADGIHWNEDGHRIVGEAVAALLQDQGYLGRNEQGGSK